MVLGASWLAGGASYEGMQLRGFMKQMDKKYIFVHLYIYVHTAVCMATYMPFLALFQ